MPHHKLEAVPHYKLGAMLHHKLGAMPHHTLGAMPHHKRPHTSHTPRLLTKPQPSCRAHHVRPGVQGMNAKVWLSIPGARATARRPAPAPPESGPPATQRQSSAQTNAAGAAAAAEAEPPAPSAAETPGGQQGVWRAGWDAWQAVQTAGCGVGELVGRRWVGERGGARGAGRDGLV
eukprot:1884-Chlamydomonas_euryale.AAC.1